MSDLNARMEATRRPEFEELMCGLYQRMQQVSPEILVNRRINRSELRQIYPVSDMTIWRLEKRGRFPKHTTICGRNYWPFMEVLKALSRLEQEGNDG